jgi:hypothetical protein
LLGDPHKVAIGRQHRKRVPDAELCEERIDGCDLCSSPTARIPEIRSIDVIAPVRRQKWQGRKTVQNFSARLRTGKSLEEFLENEPGCDDLCTSLDRARQTQDFR